jgi:acyl carrier protein
MIEDRIVELVVKQLKFKLPGAQASTFDRSLHLIDGLGIDSIDMAAVVLRVQDEFGIDVREEDYEQIASVKQIARFVRDRIALRSSSRGEERTCA